MAYTTINDPSAYFQTLLYTGGSSSYTNDGNSDLQPDWVWIKARNNAYEHKLWDSSRGTTKLLVSNSTAAEATQSGLTAFNSDGFSLGGDGGSNDASTNFVAWQWKGNGGTTTSNSDGSITSTVQANTTAGFSIVTWTGTGSNGTVGHGLGKAPDCIFFKNYTAAENWVTYHSVLGNSGGLYLNLDNSFNTASSWYSDTSPTSDYFYVGTNTKTNGGTMVAYCFADTKGYSKFGSYTGNGNADGTFVYTGFKPAYIMVKRTDSTGGWNIQDLKRSPFNVQDNFIQADDADPEAVVGTGGLWDSLSNGFKLRQNLTTTNASGGTFIYMAFAQNPLVATNDVIALAR
jgi:hypothetical protein